VKKVSVGHADRQHAISEIRIGNRYRRDLGDVSGLADSIADLGSAPNRYPSRRQTGCWRAPASGVQVVGWEQVPVTIIDLAQIVRGEFAENAYPQPANSLWKLEWSILYRFLSCASVRCRN